MTELEAVLDHNHQLFQRVLRVADVRQRVTDRVLRDLLGPGGVRHPDAEAGYDFQAYLAEVLAELEPAAGDAPAAEDVVHVFGGAPAS